MSYFVVNQTRKQIYKMSHRMEPYFEVLERNPLWTPLDEIVFVDNDVEPIIGTLTRLKFRCISQTRTISCGIWTRTNTRWR